MCVQSVQTDCGAHHLVSYLEVLEDLSLEFNEPGHEAERSPPSSTEVKDELSCTLTLL